MAGMNSLKGSPRDTLNEQEEEVKMFHKNNLLQLDYDKESFKRFFYLKQAYHEKNKLAFKIKNNSNSKLILYLGEGSSLCKMNDWQAIQVGGIRIVPNSEIVHYYHK
mmetsp:Transcript_18290/g.17412  ORF Transcript_18290/g.17412 Transcript_18290/m.17412 type:complete len:107 (+) Transcript_18290:766-1086(+)